MFAKNRPGKGDANIVEYMLKMTYDVAAAGEKCDVFDCLITVVIVVVVQVYHNGKELSPSCIIINSRTEPKLFITPGPAAYSPCRADVSSRHSQPPAFSIARAESETARRDQLNATPGQSALSYVTT